MIKRALVSVSVLGLAIHGAACASTASHESGTSAGGATGASSGGPTSGTPTATSGGGGASSVTMGSDGSVSVVTAGTDGTVTSGATSMGAVTTSGNVSTTGTDGTTTTGTVTTTGVASSTDGGGGSGGSGPMLPEPSLITSSEGAYWQVGEVTVGGDNPTVTVNDSQTHQQWYGFGGTFNEAGWDALKDVSEADRDLAIRLLFDVTDGIGFTYGRIPIGSSDYGLDRYSLDENAGDYDMANFSIDRDRQDLIPYIKAALAVKPDIWFWASPWSPPTWMKDNNAFDRGNIKNDAQTLQAHALYLARFVEEYAAEGIDIKAVHPQNEPGYLQDYPSCGWSASVLTDYIANYMGPLFADRLPSTEIWLGTMSNPNSSERVSSVMGNATAKGYVKGIGLQWGMDGNVSNYVSTYGIHVMQTEHQCGNYPWNGGNANMAPNDLAYAEESWDLLKKWIGSGVNSYLAWNMILDTVGRSLDNVRPWAQNALIVVDRAQGKLIATPTYYVFRHLGQYVNPGAVRVDMGNADGLAWKNPDGSIVAVLHNGGGSAAATTMAIGGTNVQFEVPARGWATVNWQG